MEYLLKLPFLLCLVLVLISPAISPLICEKEEKVFTPIRGVDVCVPCEPGTCMPYQSHTNRHCYNCERAMVVNCSNSANKNDVMIPFQETLVKGRKYLLFWCPDVNVTREPKIDITTFIPGTDITPGTDNTPVTLGIDNVNSTTDQEKSIGVTNSQTHGISSSECIGIIIKCLLVCLCFGPRFPTLVTYLKEKCSKQTCKVILRIIAGCSLEHSVRWTCSLSIRDIANFIFIPDLAKVLLFIIIFQMPNSLENQVVFVIACVVIFVTLCVFIRGVYYFFCNTSLTESCSPTAERINTAGDTGQHSDESTQLLDKESVKQGNSNIDTDQTVNRHSTMDIPDSSRSSGEASAATTSEGVENSVGDNDVNENINDVDIRGALLTGKKVHESIHTPGTTNNDSSSYETSSTESVAVKLKRNDDVNIDDFPCVGPTFVDIDSAGTANQGST